MSVGYMFTGNPAYLVPLAVTAGLSLGGRIYTILSTLSAGESLTVERRILGAKVEGIYSTIELNIVNMSRIPYYLREVKDSPPPLLEAEIVSRDVEVPPRGTASISYRVKGRLGRWCFGGVSAKIYDPLGFSRHDVKLKVSKDDCFTFTPRLLVVEPLKSRVLGGLAAAAGKGVLSRGEGIDYYSFRDYQPGDDPRFIEWKISSRRGSLVVKETASEGRGSTVSIIVASRKEDWIPWKSEETEYELAARTAYNLFAAAIASGISASLIVTGEKGIVKVRDLVSAGEVLAEASLPGEKEAPARALEAVSEAEGFTIIVTTLDGKFLPERMEPKVLVVSTKEWGDYVVRRDRDIISLVRELSSENRE